MHHEMSPIWFAGGNIFPYYSKSLLKGDLFVINNLVFQENGTIPDFFNEILFLELIYFKSLLLLRCPARQGWAELIKDLMLLLLDKNSIFKYGINTVGT